MKKEMFDELLASANEALEHSRGRRDLRTTVLPRPPEPMSAREVRRLRDLLNASQAVFASYLNVSTKLVQAWEADRRRPEGAALRLMRIAERAPEILGGGHATLLDFERISTRARKAAKRAGMKRADVTRAVKAARKS